MAESLPLLGFALATGAQLVLVGVWVGRATATLKHLAERLERVERRQDARARFATEST